MSKARALEATRALFGADGGEPVHHVESIGLEDDATRREAMILDVAERLARHADPVAAAEAIIAAFLVQPRPDTVEEEPLAMRAYNLRLELRRRHPEVFMEFVPPCTPNPPDPCEGVEIGPLKKEDDRRSVEEVERAAKVLGWAVRINGVLAGVVSRAAGILRDLSKRVGSDASAGTTLGALARTLDESVRAAGTQPTPESREDEETAADAMRAGGDPEAAAAFSREWRELSPRGLTTLSRERYVQINLQRNR